MPVVEQQLLRGVAANLEAQVFDSDGDPALGLTVAVTVARADGTALLTDVTTAENTTTNIGGYYTTVLTAAQLEQLDVLTATWKVSSVVRSVSYHEVVGGYFFPIADLRRAEKSLADVPAPELRAARREAEDEAERICDVAFVPRYSRVRLDGTGRTELMLPTKRPRTIRSVRVYSDATNYTAWTATELALIQLETSGRIVRMDGGTFTAGAQNIVVEVEHGYDRPPSKVRAAAMTRARYHRHASLSGLPDRATSIVQDGATIRIAQPDKWSTGEPDVDAIYDRWSSRTPAVA